MSWGVFLQKVGGTKKRLVCEADVCVLQADLSYTDPDTSTNSQLPTRQGGELPAQGHYDTLPAHLSPEFSKSNLS